MTAKNQPAKRTKRLIGVRDIAEKLGCSPKVVYRRRDDGTLPTAIMLGGLVKWSEEVIDDWIDAGCPRQPQTQRK